MQRILRLEIDNDSLLAHPLSYRPSPSFHWWVIRSDRCILAFDSNPIRFIIYIIIHLSNCRTVTRKETAFTKGCRIWYESSIFGDRDCFWLHKRGRYCIETLVFSLQLRFLRRITKMYSSTLYLVRFYLVPVLHYYLFKYQVSVLVLNVLVLSDHCGTAFLFI